MTLTFLVTGMTCAACSAHVERAVSALSGVDTVSVNLMSGRMRVDAKDPSLTAQSVIDAVVRAGYGASVWEDAARARMDAETERTLHAMRQRLAVSFAFLLPLFYLSMGHMMGLPLPAIITATHLRHAVLQLVLLLPILYVNRSYFINGFRRLFTLAPNMDSLVALGAAAGVVYSLIEMFLPHDGAAMPELYFESAGMIVSLVTIGKYMEQRSRGRTTSAVSALMALAPDTVVLLRDGEEVTVSASEVSVGDILIVRQGARIGVDGTVVFGSGTVDESAITGESLPVEKEVGDAVTAATICKSGYLRVQASRIGSDTTLAQIVRLMEDAAASKAPIARLADQVSGVFVPVVIAIALVSALIWHFAGADTAFALSIAIAVLVISCPCALGLATPVAITVGTGRAAERGILIKSAESLELLHKVDTVVLDKTGTVTEGTPAVTHIICTRGIDETHLLSLAGMLESSSEHPLARAIVDHARAQGLPLSQTPTGFTAMPGGGVAAILGGVRVLGGNERLMAAHGVDCSALAEEAAKLAPLGATPLYFAADGALLGIIALADRVKPTSAAAVTAFRARGMEVVLLTGDNHQTADAIARSVGIDRVIAEVLPQDKEQCVAQLRAEGRTVAMIGDGINDAPALARADVGLAIGTGTDVAIESADVVLMKSDLLDAVDAVDVSRATMRNIRQNLFWAFFYNSVSIPIAAGVFYPAFAFKLSPMLGAAAMSLSSVCVVFNALRLQRWRGTARDLCNIPQTKNKEERKEETAMNEKILTIEGMMCTHCSGRVESVLNALDGVRATVDLEAKTATVRSENVLDEALLKKTVTDAGYTVVDIK
ncbi:MAG: heavy metal translocating P-type ATPase [Oscillospiraceae bacterium]|nr:heavy metal translocating P-type ATPase [Oscillospiraceae bacterium]